MRHAGIFERDAGQENGYGVDIAKKSKHFMGDKRQRSLKKDIYLKDLTSG